VDFRGQGWKLDWPVELVEDICDFTRNFAASELIILPQKPSFEHEVGNEK
jgi:hypothetical protein